MSERASVSSAGESEFFLITTPGLEGLTGEELATLYPERGIQIHRGGVGIQLPLEEGLALNHRMRTANRIVVRLAEFGCRDFPKLFRRIARFPWSRWVSDETRIEFTASSHSSRLKIKKRIEETCADGRKRYLKETAGPTSGRDAEPTALVLIRFENDVCTLSLDTSGELLYRRGQRTLIAEAPLRETIAAALVRLLFSEAAPDDKELEIVDPMMGGGTFLIEALEMNHLVRSRTFAYEGYEPLLARIGGRERIETVLSGFASAAGLAASNRRIVSVIGFERDEKVRRAAQSNLGEINGAGSVSMDLKGGDFFLAPPLPDLETPRGRRWVLANPPYGERLKVEGSLKSYYERLLTRIEEVTRPERACFVFPERARPEHFRLPDGWRQIRSLRFLNGGFPVSAVLYHRKCE